jgi:hypothetical protein
VLEPQVEPVDPKKIDEQDVVMDEDDDVVRGAALQGGIVADS